MERGEGKVMERVRGQKGVKKGREMRVNELEGG